MGYVIGFILGFLLVAAFPPFLVVIVGGIVGILLAKVLFGAAGVCSRFASVIDRTSDRVIIPVCFTGSIWVAGFLYMLAHY